MNKPQGPLKTGEFVPAPDILFMPDPPPPSMDRLERSWMLRKINLVRTIWRGSKNMLNLVHPDLAHRRWYETRVANETVIAVNDADFARHVLQVNAENYKKGRFYEVVFGKFLGRSSLTMDGAEWRQRRRLISPAFNARAIKGCEAVVEKHVERMLGEWAETAEGDGIRNLSEDVSAMAMRVAMEAFFSADMGEETARIGDLMDKVITDSGSPPFADIMNLPAWAPRRSRKEAMGWLEELDEWLYALIDARLKLRGEGEPEKPDLLDILVHARDDETDELLDRQSIRNEVLVLFAAGHETTAMSLTWGLDRLAREPDWQERLAEAASAAQAEAGEPMHAAEAKGVALLPAAYDEMLRLYPPAMNVGRQAIEDDRFEDVEIKAGTRVQISIAHIQRNPKYWPEPGRFDPERFLPGGRTNRHPFAHIPFGGGPRICVGLALARLEGLLTLARALPRFRLEPIGDPPAPLGKITLRTEEPVSIRVAPRA